MSRKSIFRAGLLALILIAVFGCQKPLGQRYTLFFTNDLQAHLLPDRKGRGGLARIAYLVKQEKAKNPGRVLLLDAGDSSVGTAFGTETQGEAIFRVMNAVGYDAGVYGNHEFDLGAEQAKKYQQIAKFPLLACNIREREEKSFTEEYVIFPMGEIRIAVIGVANLKTPNLVDPASISDLKFLPPEGEIRRVQNLVAGKADIVILITHQGLREDISLTYHLSGIPLIIGGHSETKLRKMISVNQTRIAQAEHFGWWLGRIDFDYDQKTRTVRFLNYQLIPINHKIPEDPEVKSAIIEEQKNLPSGLDRVIGKSWRRLSQSFVGYWAAELLKSYGNADLGIINTGGVRSGIYRGKITPEDIYEIMPFQDRICIFEISGYELLRLKSLKYFYFSRGPKLSPAKTYKVASLDYLLKVNDFPRAVNSQIFDQLLRNVMIAQIEKDHGFKRFWDRK